MIRRISLVIISLLLIVLPLSACGEPIEGEELILAARKAYVKLDSAKVEIINMDTNEAEQTVIFKYDEKDVLSYSYETYYNGKFYKEYNNGYTMYIDDNGTQKTLKKGNKDFYCYNRELPLTYASEGLILFDKSYVEEAKVEAVNGESVVTHVYNAKKMNSSTEEGKVIGFEVIYRFDLNGNLIDMVQKTTVKAKTETKTYSYKVLISEKNEIQHIDNIVETEE